MTKEDIKDVLEIVKRADDLGVLKVERITLKMDIENVCEHVGLNLKGLKGANDENFAHDIIGIQNHNNRNTGKLENHFLPRYAKKG